MPLQYCFNLHSVTDLSLCKIFSCFYNIFVIRFHLRRLTCNINSGYDDVYFRIRSPELLAVSHEIHAVSAPRISLDVDFGNSDALDNGHAKLEVTDIGAITAYFQDA